jgi:hypothetical protein
MTAVVVCVSAQHLCVNAAVIPVPRRGRLRSRRRRRGFVTRRVRARSAPVRARTIDVGHDGTQKTVVRNARPRGKRDPNVSRRRLRGRRRPMGLDHTSCGSTQTSCAVTHSGDAGTHTTGSSMRTSSARNHRSSADTHTTSASTHTTAADVLATSAGARRRAAGTRTSSVKGQRQPGGTHTRSA